MPTEKIISLNNLDRYDKNLKTVAGILQRSTAYALGDIVHNKNIYLKCTTAGTTKATTLDLTNVAKDDTVTDGTVVWTVTSTTGPASGESSGAGLEDWQASHSYKTDELFVYEGQIYKVLNNFTSGATFEETSDIEAYVPQELTNQQINNLIDNFVPSGSGTTPVYYDDNAVGTIKAYMGITPPKDYLACDGTIYNIVDYRELAEHIKTQFGSYNFFGGDGITTFAVPDLRGEFLRGSGTNSHTNQGNGANVGVHQDGTLSPLVRRDSNNIYMYAKSNKNNWDILQDNRDSSSVSASSSIQQISSLNESTTQVYAYTSRPTNTSVLYCIKYNTSVLSTPENNYSTEEQRIGTWIDGKPLYQKTYECSEVVPYNSWTKSSILAPSNVARLISSQATTETSVMNYISCSFEDGYILLRNDRNDAVTVKSITIKYTKTTDGGGRT